MDDASFALWVSRFQVYQMIAEGKLTRHVVDPLRVANESVLAEMGEWWSRTQYPVQEQNRLGLKQKQGKTVNSMPI